MDNRNFEYMFYGLLAAWLIVVLYMVSLVARERKLRKEMDHLKHMVEGSPK